MFSAKRESARARAAGPDAAASAIKMAYAAWTKGMAAMLLAARALARAEGVEDTLLAEWALSQPSLAAQSERAATSAVFKGWRWIAEMEEIAHCMAEAGLPDGFHQAAAEIYRRCPRLPPTSTPGVSMKHTTGRPYLAAICMRLSALRRTYARRRASMKRQPTGFRAGLARRLRRG